MNMAAAKLVLFRALGQIQLAWIAAHRGWRALTDEYAKGQWRRKASEKMEYDDYRDAWNDGGDFERERCVQLCERLADTYGQLSREAQACQRIARAIGSNRLLKDIVNEVEGKS